MKKYALIVAGGSGRRMNADQPKQFLPIGGVPMLMRTVRCFAESAEGALFGTPTVLVLPENDLGTWERLCRQHSFDTPVRVVAGGATRFQSVRNGLAVIAGDGLVAIHDGVRPFVSAGIIAEGFRVAEQHGAAVAAVPLKDSLRQVAGDGSRACDRRDYRLVQTPQTFRLSILREAFRAAESPDFTDDASVVERAGFAIHLIEGSYENIKITTSEDLQWAEMLAQRPLSR